MASKYLDENHYLGSESKEEEKASNKNEAIYIFKMLLNSVNWVWRF